MNALLGAYYYPLFLFSAVHYAAASLIFHVSCIELSRCFSSFFSLISFRLLDLSGLLVPPPEEPPTSVGCCRASPAPDTPIPSSIMQFYSLASTSSRLSWRSPSALHWVTLGHCSWRRSRLQRRLRYASNGRLKDADVAVTEAVAELCVLMFMFLLFLLVCFCCFCCHCSCHSMVPDWKKNKNKKYKRPLNGRQHCCLLQYKVVSLAQPSRLENRKQNNNKFWILNYNGFYKILRFGGSTVLRFYRMEQNQRNFIDRSDKKRYEIRVIRYRIWNIWE